jgi:hypothetical protein
MVIRSWTVAVLVLLVACAPAAGTPTQATVRVEGSSSTLFEERALTTDTRTVPVGECTGQAATREVPGATALGILTDAATTGGFAFDTSSFGPGPGDLFVCVAGADGGSPTEFWLYKVNSIAPEVGGGNYTLSSGDRVLWYFTSDFAAKTLDLSSPPRAATGSSFRLDVNAYDNSGAGVPADGATVASSGPASGTSTTGADGRAVLSLASPGLYSFKAARAGDIRSNVVNVCVSDSGTGDCLSLIQI